MAEAKVYARASLRAFVSPEALIKVVQEAVAENMNCHDGIGIPIRFLPRDIDVLVFFHKDDEMATGSAMMVEVSTYGYQDRLVNIDERMRSIRERLSSLIPLQKSGWRVSSTFTAIPLGCCGQTQ